MPCAVSTIAPQVVTPPSGPLIVSLEGLELTSGDKKRLRHTAVGGVILFSRNYKSKEQLSDLVCGVREVSPDCLITVDHEGGRVQRFVDGWTRLPPPARLGEVYSDNRELALRLSRAYGQIIANELKGSGIDLSFAPVLDLGVNQSVIGDRAFHTDPGVVYELGRAWIDGAHASGMPAVGKHFPGHGSVTGDTHVESAYDARPAGEVQRHDGAPFRRLIDDGALDAVMTSHVVYGDEAMPATFSAYWLQTVLREEWGFRGLVFSDDLTMRASMEAGGVRRTVSAAMEAGCDMVLVCYKEDAMGRLDALLEEWPDDMARQTQRYTQHMERLQKHWRAFSGMKTEGAEMEADDKSALLKQLEMIR